MTRDILVNPPTPAAFGYTVAIPHSPLECHVLFEWPLKANPEL
jgi:hypothetical protein